MYGARERRNASWIGWSDLDFWYRLERLANCSGKAALDGTSVLSCVLIVRVLL